MMPEGAQQPRVSACIRQSMSACVITKYTTSGTFKNCPNLEKNCSAVFIVWVVGFDCDF